MTTKRKRSVTLAEYQAQLKVEGKLDEYLKRRQAADAEHRAREEKYAQAEALIVQELRTPGMSVKFPQHDIPCSRFSSAGSYLR